MITIIVPAINFCLFIVIKTLKSSLQEVNLHFLIQFGNIFRGFKEKLGRKGAPWIDKQEKSFLLILV